MDPLLQPKEEAIIYRDDKLYVCLASYPLTVGHTIVVWNDPVADLHLLSKDDYEYLSNKVDWVRNALLKSLDIDKVYLVYMDELKHVHWHLIPRYNEQGYDVFKHSPEELRDFSLVQKIKQNLSE